MNSFTRGLSVALFSLGLAGLSGCDANNETETQKLAKSIGEPGAANPKAIPATPVTTPTTQAEREAQRVDPRKDMKAQGYPAKK